MRSATREQEFRDQAQYLVGQHWPEIAAVAEELLRCGTLDDSEVEIIADAIDERRDIQQDLATYRMLKAGHPKT